MRLTLYKLSPLSLSKAATANAKMVYCCGRISTRGTLSLPDPAFFVASASSVGKYFIYGTLWWSIRIITLYMINCNDIISMFYHNLPYMKDLPLCCLALARRNAGSGSEIRKTEFDSNLSKFEKFYGSKSCQNFGFLAFILFRYVISVCEQRFDVSVGKAF